MKNLTTILVAGMSAMLLSVSCMAQTTEVTEATETQSGLKVPPSLDQPERTTKYNDGDTGLTVEETRYKDRLGNVTIQHGEDGIREYYDLTNTDEIYQDGGLIERGATRTWRLGGGK